MTINIKNLTKDNLRIRMVPKADSTITLGVGNTNPAAYIDETGALVGCVSKPVFHCMPIFVDSHMVSRPAGQIYYYWNNSDLTQKWAFTCTSEVSDGTIETKTYRWVRADHDYSDVPYYEVISNKVKLSGGGGSLAHFEIYMGNIQPAGISEDDPENWAILRFHPTPNLAADEADYFTECIKPQIGEDELLAVSCGMQVFPGK